MIYGRLAAAWQGAKTRLVPGLVAGVVFAGLWGAAVGAEESRRQELDVTVGLEALNDSNVNLSDVSAEDDTRLTVFGEVSLARTTYTEDRIELGAKVRNETYFDHDQYDGAEVQGFGRYVKKTSNGKLGVEGHFSSISDPVSQDLLLTDRSRRRVGDAAADWEAKWYKTELSVGGGFERVDYDDPALAGTDNSTIDGELVLGRDVSPNLFASFRYGHRAVDYDEDVRTDYDTDSFGAGVRYGEGRKIALEGNIKLTRVKPDGASAENVVTGLLRATWDIRQEKSRLMFLLARDVVPASVGVYSANSKTSVVWEHKYNSSVASELGLVYERGEYWNAGDIEVKRLSVYGGATITLGRNTTAYARVGWGSRESDGGSGLDYDSTTVNVGVTYGF